jgi:hypothetical protein
MLFSDEHVSIDCHENGRDVGAHFKNFTKIADEDDFNHLSGHSVVNRGTKEPGLILVLTIVDRIDRIQDTK